MIKEKVCALLGHPKNIHTHEEAKGKQFRFVKSCRCGKHADVSVLLHDNDLLADITINDANFPIDKPLSY